MNPPNGPGGHSGHSGQGGPGGAPYHRATAETEWHVVGGIIAGGAFTATEVRRRTGLQPGHFNDPLLALAYGTLLDIAERDGEIDKPTLRRAMEAKIRDLELPGMTAGEFMTAAYDPAYSRRMVLKHAYTLRESSVMLSARRELADLTRLGDEWDAESAAFLEEAQRRFMALAAGNDAAESRPRALSDLMGDFWLTFEEEYHCPQLQRGLPTGFPTLDGKTRGLCPGELIVIAAETGQGKSAFAANVAVNACRTGSVGEGQRPAALMFSMEMQWRELVERMIFAESGVESTGYRRKSLTAPEWGKLQAARDRLASMRISIQDDANLTAGRIVSACREARFAGACDLVVVDYTQLVSPPEPVPGQRASARAESREREVAMVVHALQKMAMELSIPVIALSQLNDDGRMRESRSLAHFANVIIRLKCLEDPDGEGYSEKTEYSYDLLVEKCRAGQKGKIPLVFKPSLTKFQEQTV